MYNSSPIPEIHNHSSNQLRRFFLTRLPLRMVFEAGKAPLVPTTQLLKLNCRTEAHLATKLNGFDHRSYEDAISALNGLQTNSVTLKESIGRAHNTQCNHVKETQVFLEKIGITLDDLDKLSVIHVAGTKGKGSTCALVESILRNQNVKTGFYSSPHLLNVTERIRINGEPISKTKFSQYFWKIYGTLEETKQSVHDMPPYFKFLTIMAYYVFLKEKVDVAVVEVGIGGEYDCTNVVRNTKTVGITSLGLEHTQLLGQTYKDIAWQKSGIIKSGSSVFSTHQNDECIPVLLERAHEKNANLRFIPDFMEYKYHDANVFNDIATNPTKLRNASLAIQLSYDWIRKNPHKLTNKSICEHVDSSDNLTLPVEVMEALVNCYWPGRCQTLIYRNLTLYIDGAHTIDSLQLCVDWFNDKTNSRPEKKLLLFNVTGDRNVSDMLDIINSKIQFEQALFTPNISSLQTQDKDNLYTFAQPNHSKRNAEYWSSLKPQNKSKDFSCLADVFKYLQKHFGHEETSILVTGSLHLVGEVLRTIKE
ncbi:folylpolyglutamate synthase, mitochondrial [Contarinia nasturtii]|uniref:folylpolyglutamate synthase, mitochondrial n=1 Tax=Contarinia nasturtii TaxID=265458 RepID=UPI0012D49F58|nr:folylpolyglutamate synthase, mitochondrial [Contarinia nasturtii]